MRFLFILISLVNFYAALASAHEEASPLGLPNGFSIQGTIATSYRTLALVGSNERWVIPGFLMGGEALPRPQGLHLDEVLLNSTYGAEDTYATVKFGQHGEDEGLEVEHALVGRRIGSSFLIEAGRMSAVMSPYHAPHPSQTPFADALLIYDALWGRQYNEQGLRLRSRWPGTGWEAGLEYWQGNSFPARRKDNSAGAYDLYLTHSARLETVSSQLGIFHYKGEAQSRSDERYTAEHNHGVDLTTIPLFYFDGTTEVQGLHGRLVWNQAHLILGVEGELQLSKSSGQLRDLTRLAPIETVYKGYWWSLYQSLGSHLFAFRYERLQFENDLGGAAATVLASQALLIGDKDPFRMSAAYNFQWDESLRLRAEWSRDFTTSAKRDRGTLGLVWAKQEQIMRSQH